MKIKKIEEVVDQNDNIIGSDFPENDGNLDTYVGDGKQITDKNVHTSHQDFKGDFMGMFGIGFYESKEKNNDKIIEEDAVLNQKIEDKLLDKEEDKSEIQKKEIKKLADIINKLDKPEYDKLISLIERK